MSVFALRGRNTYVHGGEKGHGKKDTDTQLNCRVKRLYRPTDKVGYRVIEHATKSRISNREDLDFHLNADTLSMRLAESAILNFHLVMFTSFGEFRIWGCLERLS